MNEYMNVPLTNGDEVDAFGKHRRSLKWRPGVLKAIKTRYNRRNRKSARLTLQEVDFSSED
jgi:hypothetical protein